jgi:hypothetical protein
VRLGGEAEGARDQVAVDRGVVRGDGVQQPVDELLMLFGDLDGRHRNSVLRRFSGGILRERGVSQAKETAFR